MRQEFQSVQQMRQHYDDVGARLRNPRNRVQDDGIDLRRPRKGFVPIDEMRTEQREEYEQKIRAFIESCFALVGQSDPELIDIEPEPRRPTVGEIKRAVCRHFRLRMVDLESARRQLAVTRPRQVAMYLAKTLTLNSYPYISRQFGGRDHTTAMHAVRRIETLMALDPDLRVHVETIAQALGETL